MTGRDDEDENETGFVMDLQDTHSDYFEKSHDNFSHESDQGQNVGDSDGRDEESDEH
jgi:hypothetical protein